MPVNLFEKASKLFNPEIDGKGCLSRLIYTSYEDIKFIWLFGVPQVTGNKCSAPL